jgi:hypothetical protein
MAVVLKETALPQGVRDPYGVPSHSISPTALAPDGRRLAFGGGCE